MELKQKYTEVNFEIHDNFLKKIRLFGSETSFKIGTMLDKSFKKMNSKQNSYVSGVVNDVDNNAVFFKVFYRRQNQEVVLKNIEKISSDNYLDSIIDKKYL